MASLAAPPRTYEPPSGAAATRHAVLGAELLRLVAAADRQSAADLLARWHASGTVDPWHLVLALAGLAVKRPCGRAHPPRGRT